MLAFVGAFALWCVLILVAERLADSWRATGERVQARDGSQCDPEPDPSGPTANGFHEEAASSSTFAKAVPVARRDDRQ